MAKPGKTGIIRVIEACGYSIKGFKATWQNEAAFRQEVVLGIILTPCAFLLGTTLTQIALLLTTLYGVILAELTNSAIESVVDRISDEHHELSGRAKDQGSALVMLAICLCTVVWIMVALERLGM